MIMIKRGCEYLIGLLLLLVSSMTFAASPAQTALVLDVTGAIGPATQDYISRGIKQADVKKASLVILTIDTPGGLETSMRLIIRDILGSAVPVVAYVAPSGARAASAGTYILYGSHVAAMAPGTNLGAATPVSLGEKAEKQSSIEKKMESDASAFIRSLAQLRGRNADWGVKAVLESASLSAEEALKLGVIDLIANDLGDLIHKVNGRSVLVQGKKMTLALNQVNLQQVVPDWRVKFLSVITDPNIAYILLLVGIYGLFFEFMNPGFVLPGVAGTISLLIALYAFQLLPVNYVGLALILLGIGFIVAEAFVPAYGALGVGGVIAFIMGSIMLFDTNVPGFYLIWPLIIALALFTAGFILFIIQLALRAHHKPVVSGREEMIGSTGKVFIIKGDEEHPRVRIRGELWQVRSNVPLENGQEVIVTGIDELILIVEPHPQGHSSSKERP